MRISHGLHKVGAYTNSMDNPKWCSKEGLGDEAQVTPNSLPKRGWVMKRAVAEVSHLG